jgi:hypothetical protein
MSFDYAEIAQVAHEILAEFGAEGVLTRKERGTVYDPGTGGYSETMTTQSCTAVVFPIDQKLVNGTTVLATDEQAYLSAVGLTIPQTGQALTWQGADYTLMNVENLAPAGLSVLVELIVRK